MTARNFSYAWDQEFPALTKWLFVALTECAGASQTYDVKEKKFLDLCGMTSSELFTSLKDLETRNVLRIVRQFDDGEFGWTIQFTYPGEFHR